MPIARNNGAAGAVQGRYGIDSLRRYQLAWRILRDCLENLAAIGMLVCTTPPVASLIGWLGTILTRSSLSLFLTTEERRRGRDAGTFSHLAGAYCSRQRGVWQIGRRQRREERVGQSLQQGKQKKRHRLRRRCR